MKNPIVVTVSAVVLALAINLYYYNTGDELTAVISKTLFADLILVLTLVPLYQAIVTKSPNPSSSFPERIKSGMKPVAMYTILIAIITYVLFTIYGDVLVDGKMSALAGKAQESLDKGEMTADEVKTALEMTKKFYSVSFYLPIVLLSNLFVGFISSILAGILVKK